MEAAQAAEEAAARARHAALLEREAAENVLHDAVPDLQARNAAKQLADSVRLPMSTTSATLAPIDPAVTSPAVLAPVSGNAEHNDHRSAQSEFDAAVHGSGLALPEPPAATKPVMPVTVTEIDNPGLLVSDVTGHLVPVAPGQHLDVDDNVDASFREVDVPGAGRVLLPNTLIAAAFDQVRSAAGSLQLVPKVSGIVAFDADSNAQVMPDGPMFVRPYRNADESRSRMEVFGGPAVGWLRVDADRSSARSRRAQGPLYPSDVDVPRPADVLQGSAADCYLFANLLGMASNTPSLITDMIAPAVVDGQPVYRVRFYDPETADWVWVTVDDTFYVNADGTMTYAVHGADQPLWAAVIEKAWAVFHGGEHGYHGLDLGMPGKTAAMLRPPTLPGPKTGRAQPTRAVDEPMFADPFQLDRDTLAELLGRSGFARMVLDAESRFAALGRGTGAQTRDKFLVFLDKEVKTAATRAGDRLRRAQVRPSELADLDRAAVAEILGGDGLADAVLEVLAGWDAADDALGHNSFSAFLTEQWQGPRRALEQHLDAWKSDTKLSDTTVAQWMADRIDHLVRRGDTVSLGTKAAFDTATYHPSSVLTAKHAYSVVRVDRSGATTRVVIRDPQHDREIGVPIDELNQFTTISAAGAGTLFAFGAANVTAASSSTVAARTPAGDLLGVSNPFRRRPAAGATTQFTAPPALPGFGLLPSSVQRAEKTLEWWTAHGERWWNELRFAELPQDARYRLTTKHHMLRDLAGIPAAVRDEMNRGYLTAELDRLARVRSDRQLTAGERKLHLFVSQAIRGLAQAEEYARRGAELSGIAAPPVYLLSCRPQAFDGAGSMILSYGDADRAETVAWHVPSQRPAGLPQQWRGLRTGIDLYTAAEHDSLAASTAVVVWMAHDGAFGPESTASALNWAKDTSADGKQRLASAVSRFHGVRTVLERGGAAPPPHTLEVHDHRWHTNPGEIHDRPTRRIDQPVNRALHGLPAADPGLPVPVLVSMPVTRRLFTGVPGEQDVLRDNDRRHAGDQHLSAQLRELARERPGWVRRMVRERLDGAYEVRFTGPDGRAIRVAVDRQFPAYDGAMAYGAHRPDRPLWPLVVEKAWQTLLSTEESGPHIQGALRGNRYSVVNALRPAGEWTPAGSWRPTRGAVHRVDEHPMNLSESALAAALGNADAAEVISGLRHDWERRQTVVPDFAVWEAVRAARAAARAPENSVDVVLAWLQQGGDIADQHRFEVELAISTAEQPVLRQPLRQLRTRLLSYGEAVSARWPALFDALTANLTREEFAHWMRVNDVSTTAGFRAFLEEQFVGTEHQAMYDSSWPRLLDAMSEWDTDAPVSLSALRDSVGSRLHQLFEHSRALIVSTRPAWPNSPTESGLLGDYRYEVSKVFLDDTNRVTAVLLTDDTGRETTVPAHYFNQFLVLSVYDQADRPLRTAAPAPPQYPADDLTPPEYRAEELAPLDQYLDEFGFPVPHQLVTAIVDRYGSQIVVPSADFTDFARAPIAEVAATPLGLLAARDLDGPLFGPTGRPLVEDLRHLPQWPVVRHLRNLAADPAALERLLRPVVEKSESATRAVGLDVLLPVSGTPTWIRVQRSTALPPTEQANTPVWGALFLEALAAARVLENQDASWQSVVHFDFTESIETDDAGPIPLVPAGTTTSDAPVEYVRSYPIRRPGATRTEVVFGYERVLPTPIGSGAVQLERLDVDGDLVTVDRVELARLGLPAFSRLRGAPWPDAVGPLADHLTHLPDSPAVNQLRQVAAEEPNRLRELIRVDDDGTTATVHLLVQGRPQWVRVNGVTALPGPARDGTWAGHPTWPAFVLEAYEATRDDIDDDTDLAAYDDQELFAPLPIEQITPPNFVLDAVVDHAALPAAVAASNPLGPHNGTPIGPVLAPIGLGTRVVYGYAPLVAADGSVVEPFDGGVLSLQARFLRPDGTDTARVTGLSGTVDVPMATLAAHGYHWDPVHEWLARAIPLPNGELVFEHQRVVVDPRPFPGHVLLHVGDRRHWIDERVAAQFGLVRPGGTRVSGALTLPSGAQVLVSQLPVVVDPSPQTRPGQILLRNEGEPLWVAEDQAAAAGLRRARRLDRPIFGRRGPTVDDLAGLQDWPEVAELRARATNPVNILNMVRYVVVDGGALRTVDGIATAIFPNHVDKHGNVLGQGGRVLVGNSNVIGIDVLLTVAGQPRWVRVDRSTVIQAAMSDATPSWPLLVLEAVGAVRAYETGIGVPVHTAPRAAPSLLTQAFHAPSDDEPAPRNPGSTQPVTAVAPQFPPAQFAADVEMALPRPSSGPVDAGIPVLTSPGSRLAFEFPPLVQRFGAGTRVWPPFEGGILLVAGTVDEQAGHVALSGPNGPLRVPVAALAEKGYRWDAANGWYARAVTVQTLDAGDIVLFEHQTVVAEPHPQLPDYISVRAGKETYTIATAEAHRVGIRLPQQLGGELYGARGPVVEDLAGLPDWAAVRQLRELVADPAAITTMLRPVLDRDGNLSHVDVAVLVSGERQWVRVDRSTVVPADPAVTDLATTPIWPYAVLAAHLAARTIGDAAAIDELKNSRSIGNWAAALVNDGLFAPEGVDEDDVAAGLEDEPAQQDTETVVHPALVEELPGTSTPLLGAPLPVSGPVTVGPPHPIADLLDEGELAALFDTPEVESAAFERAAIPVPDGSAESAPAGMEWPMPVTTAHIAAVPGTLLVSDSEQRLVAIRTARSLPVLAREADGHVRIQLPDGRTAVLTPEMVAGAFVPGRRLNRADGQELLRPIIPPSPHSLGWVVDAAGAVVELPGKAFRARPHSGEPRYSMAVHAGPEFGWYAVEPTRLDVKAERARGPLYGPTGLPQPGDAKQGRLGDCYLIAPLIGMATDHPGLITDMIKPVEDLDGMYDVRFYDEQTHAWVWVRVDDTFYHRGTDGTMIYAVQNPDQPFWPALVEKAFAILRGGAAGYQGIHGGNSAAAGATLRPPVLPGTAGRSQPSASERLSLTRMPFLVDYDTMIDIAGSAGFVRMMQDWEHEFRTAQLAQDDLGAAFKTLALNHVKAELKRVRAALDSPELASVPLSAITRADLIARLGDNGTVDAVLEALSAWTNDDNRVGFVTRLGKQWRAASGAVEQHLSAWFANTRLADTTVAQWLAARIEFLLSRGDTVSLGTRSNIARTYHPTAPVVSSHGYSVRRVLRSGTDTFVEVVDPRRPGTVLQVPLGELNLFRTLSSTGAGTMFASGARPDQSVNAAARPTSEVLEPAPIAPEWAVAVEQWFDGAWTVQTAAVTEWRPADPADIMLLGTSAQQLFVLHRGRAGRIEALDFQGRPVALDERGIGGLISDHRLTEFRVGRIELAPQYDVTRRVVSFTGLLDEWVRPAFVAPVDAVIDRETLVAVPTPPRVRVPEGGILRDRGLVDGQRYAVRRADDPALVEVKPVTGGDAWLMSAEHAAAFGLYPAQPIDDPLWGPEGPAAEDVPELLGDKEFTEQLRELARRDPGAIVDMFAMADTEDRATASRYRIMIADSTGPVLVEVDRLLHPDADGRPVVEDGRPVWPHLVRKAYERTRFAEILGIDTAAIDFAPTGDQLRQLPADARVTTIAADGNCFFRAVSAIIGQDHATIRADLVDYLLDRRAEFEHFVAVEEGVSRAQKFLDDVTALRRDGTYANDAADFLVVAAARRYGIDLAVMDDAGNIVETHAATGSSARHYLLRREVAGGHYNLATVSAQPSGRGQVHPSGTPQRQGTRRVVGAAVRRLLAVLAGVPRTPKAPHTVAPWFDKELPPIPASSARVSADHDAPLWENAIDQWFDGDWSDFSGAVAQWRPARRAEIMLLGTGTRHLFVLHSGPAGQVGVLDFDGRPVVLDARGIDGLISDHQVTEFLLGHIEMAPQHGRVVSLTGLDTLLAEQDDVFAAPTEDTTAAQATELARAMESLRAVPDYGTELAAQQHGPESGVTPASGRPVFAGTSVPVPERRTAADEIVLAGVAPLPEVTAPPVDIGLHEKRRLVVGPDGLLYRSDGSLFDTRWSANLNGGHQQPTHLTSSPMNRRAILVMDERGNMWAVPSGEFDGKTITPASLLGAGRAAASAWIEVRAGVLTVLADANGEYGFDMSQHNGSALLYLMRGQPGSAGPVMPRMLVAEDFRHLRYIGSGRTPSEPGWIEQDWRGSRPTSEQAAAPLGTAARRPLPIAPDGATSQLVETALQTKGSRVWPRDLPTITTEAGTTLRPLPGGILRHRALSTRVRVDDNGERSYFVTGADGTGWVTGRALHSDGYRLDAANGRFARELTLPTSTGPITLAVDELVRVEQDPAAPDRVLLYRGAAAPVSVAADQADRLGLRPLRRLAHRVFATTGPSIDDLAHIDLAPDSAVLEQLRDLVTTHRKRLVSMFTSLDRDFGVLLMVRGRPRWVRVDRFTTMDFTGTATDPIWPLLLLEAVAAVRKAEDQHDVQLSLYDREYDTDAGSWIPAADVDAERDSRVAMWLSTVTDGAPAAPEPTTTTTDDQTEWERAQLLIVWTDAAENDPDAQLTLYDAGRGITIQLTRQELADQGYVYSNTELGKRFTLPIIENAHGVPIGPELNPAAPQTYPAAVTPTTLDEPGADGQLPAADILVPPTGVTLPTATGPLHLAAGTRIAARRTTSYPDHVWIKHERQAQWQLVAEADLATAGLAVPHVVRVLGDLFGQDGLPYAHETGQIGLGTCYLQSLLRSLTTTHPDWIQQMVEERDGGFAVRFSGPTGYIWIPVDRRFYAVGSGADQRLAYGVHEPGRPLWAVVIEKALAIYVGGDRGYAGISGGTAAATAAILAPMHAWNSIGRPSRLRATDDLGYAHPMTMGQDALAALVGSSALARDVLQLEQAWRDRIKNQTQAGPEHNPYVAEGFRAFLRSTMDPTSFDRLLRATALWDAMRDWESGRPQPTGTALTQWALDRIGYLVDHGDAVVLGTRGDLDQDAPGNLGLLSGHAYTVLGVETDAATGHVTGVVVVDPGRSMYDPAAFITVTQTHLNAFLMLSSAGPGSWGAHGHDYLPTQRIGFGADQGAPPVPNRATRPSQAPSTMSVVELSTNQPVAPPIRRSTRPTVVAPIAPVVATAPPASEFALPSAATDIPRQGFSLDAYSGHRVRLPGKARVPLRVHDNHVWLWAASEQNSTPQWHQFDKDAVTGRGVEVPQVVRMDNLLFDPDRLPSVLDVEQGMFGTCYLMADLIGLAQQHPNWIHDMIMDMHDGTFDVRFTEQVDDLHRREVWISVDRNFYVYDAERPYAQRKSGMPLWAMVIEKAWAKYRGGDHRGYVGIEGGSAAATAAAFEPPTVTGRHGRLVPSRAMDDHYFAHPLTLGQDALAELIVVPGVPDENAHRDALELAAEILDLEPAWREWMNKWADHTNWDRARSVWHSLHGTNSAIDPNEPRYRQWLDGTNAHTSAGFRTFLRETLRADRYAALAPALEVLHTEMARWESGQPLDESSVLTQWVADRISALLARGDNVTVGTRLVRSGNVHPHSGLLAGHGLAVTRVVTENGRAIALELRDSTDWIDVPNGVVSSRIVSVRHLNQFLLLSSAGPGTRFAHGWDAVATPAYWPVHARVVVGDRALDLAGTGADRTVLSPQNDLSDRDVPLTAADSILAHRYEADSQDLLPAALVKIRTDLEFESNGVLVPLEAGSRVAVRLDTGTPDRVLVYAEAVGTEVSTWHAVDRSVLVDAGVTVPALIRVTGPLFGAGGLPAATDVKQGDIGTCYLMADLIGLAAKHPIWVQAMIQPRDGGGWKVRFTEEVVDESGRPAPRASAFDDPVRREVWIEVDDRFYAVGTDMAYAAHEAGHPLWPAVIEKAWAIYTGKHEGYAGIEGGLPGVTGAALWPTVLTGSSGRTLSKRAVDDMGFAHPMSLGVDLVTDILGDATLAKEVLSLESEWQAWMNSWADLSTWDRVAAEMERIDTLGLSEEDASAAFWNWLSRQDARTSAGFAEFLKASWGFVETDPLGEQLAPLFEVMRRWESGTPMVGSPVAQWAGDRIKHLLDRGDTVVLSTRRLEVGRRHPFTDLTHQHAHVVAGVVTDAAGKVTAVRLIDPFWWLPEHRFADGIEVPLQYLNQFESLSSVGMGARSAYGWDTAVPTAEGYGTSQSGDELAQAFESTVSLDSATGELTSPSRPQHDLALWALEVLRNSSEPNRRAWLANAATGITDHDEYAGRRYGDKAAAILGDLDSLNQKFGPTRDFRQLLIDPGVVSETYRPAFLEFVRARKWTEESVFDMRHAFSESLGTTTYYRALKLTQEAAEQIEAETGLSSRAWRAATAAPGLEDAIRAGRPGVLDPREIFDAPLSQAITNHVRPFSRTSTMRPWGTLKPVASYKTAATKEQQGASRINQTLVTQRAGELRTAEFDLLEPYLTAAARQLGLLGEADALSVTAFDKLPPAQRSEIYKVARPAYSEARSRDLERLKDADAFQSVTLDQRVAKSVAATPEMAGQLRDGESIYLFELELSPLDVIDPEDYIGSAEAPKSVKFGGGEWFAYTGDIEGIVLGHIHSSQIRSAAPLDPAQCQDCKMELSWDPVTGQVTEHQHPPAESPDFLNL
ncbi:C2 family cysteine protease [Nocardia rhizosphaerihabitans]|uniref:C2 family cysteine protease n=1 Tax=Nocardia rhizosphaerihabitans TaxID=1691570 RepID=UPI001E443822|nr:C2 family cysteine protease [Nocardia rhizosphaerihabitans]